MFFRAEMSKAAVCCPTLNLTIIGNHFKIFGADHIQVSGCAAGRYADGRVQHCSGLFRGTKHTFAPNLKKM